MFSSGLPKVKMMIMNDDEKTWVVLHQIVETDNIILSAS